MNDCQGAISGAQRDRGSEPPLSVFPDAGASRNAARERGKHTEEILAEYGRSPEEICGLREARVI